MGKGCRESQDQEPAGEPGILCCQPPGNLGQVMPPLSLSFFVSDLGAGYTITILSTYQVSGPFSGHVTYTNLLLSSQVDATNRLLQRGFEGSERGFAQPKVTQLETAKTCGQKGHSPQPQSCPSHNEGGAKGSQSAGVCWQERDRGRTLPGVLLRTQNGWPERLATPLPRSLQAGPLVYKFPR